MAAAPLLLEGIKVVDFGRFIAGPYCAALLGDHGADVIRVERRTGGEDRCLPPVAPTGESGTFLQMNRNKRGMTLDMQSPDAPEIVRRLVRAADVVVANLPPATLAKWGLDFETVQALNPRVVLTLATAYGRGGPYSDRAGFDTVGQALSGAMHLSGESDRPVRTLANYNDIGTATACAMATIAALWQRERTGRGQLVEGSLLHTALIHTNALLIEQAVTSRDREPQGNRSFNAAPVDAFKTRSGWITVQVVGEGAWSACCRLIGRESWLKDARFASDGLRAKHGVEISAAMQAWCADLSRDEALNALNRSKIPCAPIVGLQETLDDPHVAAMGYLQAARYPGLATPFPLASHPATMSATPTGIRRSAPRLGEHTEEVMAELGFSQAEIAAMKHAGAI